MPSVPFVLSVAAPLLAVLLRMIAPAEVDASINLVWLFGLVSVFLASRYLGWSGAMYGLIWATVTAVLTTFIVAMRDGHSPDLAALGAVIIIFLAVALGAGWLSQSWQRQLISVPNTSSRETGSHPPAALPAGDSLQFNLDTLFATARYRPPFTIALFELCELADRAVECGEAAVAEALDIAEATIHAQTRTMNVTGRLDEETFIVFLQGEDVRGAWSFVERVLEEIERQPAPWDGRLHMNAGIASFEEQLSDPSELVNRARLALQSARALGHEAVVVFGGARERALGISGMFVLQPDGELREVHRTV